MKQRKPGIVFRASDLFVLLVLAWSAAADATTGTPRVPLVDGLRQPSAGAADAHVRLRQLQIEQSSRSDAEAFCDLFDAEVLSRHRHPSFP